MLPKTQSLLSSAEGSVSTNEEFVTLVQKSSFHLEKIVSRGMPSADEFWYDQAQAEWVFLAQGEAVLEFWNEGKVTLSAGEYLLIPAHHKHRVESCSEDAVWLALHFDEGN